MAGQAGGSVNVTIGATFASSFKSVFGSAEKNLSQLGGAVRELDSRLSRVNGMKKLRDDTYSAEIAWRQADKELRDMSQHLVGLSEITDKQAREFKELEKRTLALKRAFENSQQAANAMEAELKQSGVNTAALVQEQKKLERQLDATSNRMKALAAFSNSGLGTALSKIGGKFRSLATEAAIGAAGIGYFFKRNFIDTAAQFEKFETILETTEGSSDKAKKAMQWVSDFAAKTPYELAEVTEAFVKLRAYGLDPTNGLLKTLGDTGAAMGKPVMQAVEAIADAVTGENERLKEFGIKGSKKGGRVTYEYTDRSGKQRSKTIDANNRKLIESTLTAIFNQKYAGAMDKLSLTWGGMVSNISDQWARFTTMVMKSGPFEALKKQLGAALAEIDAMAKDGRLQAVAEQVGQTLVKIGNDAMELGKAIYNTASYLADFVGGWKNLGLIIAAIKLSPLVVSVGQIGWALGGAVNALLMFATGTATAGAAWLAFAGVIGKAGMFVLGVFRTLAAFMLTNPIGIALTALGVAGYLLWDNWEAVKTGLVAVWETIKTTAIAAFDAIKSAVGAVIDWLAEKTAWIFETIDKVKAGANSIGSSIGGAWQGAKNLIGMGDQTSSGSGTPASGGTFAPAAAAVPASPVSRNSTVNSTVNAPITINGATDPKETARQVQDALNRREREAMANRRSQLTDALGY